MLRNLLLATLFMWAAKGIIRAQCVPPEWFPKTETFSAIEEIQGARPNTSANLRKFHSRGFFEPWFASATGSRHGSLVVSATVRIAER
jgi:hypothetical protein